jgi:hypothetical protein
VHRVASAWWRYMIPGSERGSRRYPNAPILPASSGGGLRDATAPATMTGHRAKPGGEATEHKHETAASAAAAGYVICSLRPRPNAAHIFPGGAPDTALRVLPGDGIGKKDQGCALPELPYWGRCSS